MRCGSRILNLFARAKTGVRDPHVVEPLESCSIDLKPFALEDNELSCLHTNEREILQLSLGNLFPSGCSVKVLHPDEKTAVATNS